MHVLLLKAATVQTVAIKRNVTKLPDFCQIGLTLHREEEDVRKRRSHERWCHIQKLSILSALLWQASSSADCRERAPSTPAAALRLSAKYDSRSRSTEIWCKSAVKRSFGCATACCRMRARPGDTLSRL